MEGTKVNKGPPGNNRKFVRNRRDGSSYNHPSYQDNALSSQGGKMSSLKPRSVDHTKNVEMKPGIGLEKHNDENRQENKSNSKGKDDQSHYGQKEKRSNLKHDDRRKYNFPKEKTNARHFKQANRNQSKGNEATKQPNKNESVALKQNDNPNMSSVPQHLKPAVHVQPLQQVPENIRPTVEKKSNTAQSDDSSSRKSNQVSAEEFQGISNVGYGKETGVQISTSPQTHPEQTSGKIVQTIPGNADRSKQTTDSNRQDFQKPTGLDQNPLNPMNTIFPREARSVTDLNNTGLDSYLSSSMSSSFGPQQDFLKLQRNRTVGHNIFQDGCLSPSKLAMTQNQPCSNQKTFLAEQSLVPFRGENQDSQSHAVHSSAKQPSIDHSPNCFQTSHDELEEPVPLQGIADEKYGYRISVNSLFSTSFFTNPETKVKNNIEMKQDPLNEHNMVENHQIQEITVIPNKVPHIGENQLNVLKHEPPLNTAKQCDVVMMKVSKTSLNSHMVKNQNNSETLIPPSQLPHGQLLNEPEYFKVESSGNPLHSHEHQKCNDPTMRSTQVSRSELPKEPQRFDAINPNKIKNGNPPLLDYQLPLHARDSYKNDGNFDTRLVSPRHSKDFDKPTLGSPPPVLRDLTPRVNLESERVTAVTKDPHFSPESSRIRPYRNFTSQDEEGTERLSSGQLSGLSRENSSENTRNVNPELTSEKQAVNNVSELNSVQNVQESMAKPSLTKKNSDVQTDSLVNLNYREIPKHSMSLQADGFSESETKEPVSARCPIVPEKTTRLNKVELQPTGTNKDEYEKNGPPLLHGDDQHDDSHVQQRSFPHGPFFPNPFLSHSLLTHRQAIPSAFVYPSRVGLAGSHSGFPDVTQQTGANPSSHMFPPQGTTVCLNVGGRIFEILPATFSPYPESLLSQIFTGTVPAPINQRGHLFFDRNGYLFEIILAFARVGYLTLPQNVNLTSLKNESTFFGMYEYMFQKDKNLEILSGNVLQFQRTTRCTLDYDDSTKTSVSRVFVLQGDDKLKIESLRVSGQCCLYVDLYTPLGVRETSNFVIYTPDKPDLWKAYQFCAERQLVFHLEQAHTESPVTACNKSSAEIVFAQIFVFTGDQFLS